MSRIEAISKFFDDEEKAHELLKEACNGITIKMEDGTECCIEMFYERHEQAYQRRLTHNISHSIKILENELKQSTRHGCPFCCREKPLNLEYYDSRKDHKGNYQAYLGYWENQDDPEDWVRD